MKAMFPVQSQCIAADELGKLSGSDAPHEIHLEEAILRMQEAGRASYVHAVAATNCRNAVIVTLELFS